jgi:DNA-binding response OmpR family regulator
MDKPRKILIVDDEPSGRQLLEAILYPEGYEIIFAKDGLEAFNAIINDLPDLVLLDVMMPKMDGFEVCKKVRERQETAHIPIFLITALDDRDSKIRGIDSGADDYISKPFDRVEILAKIKNRTTLLQFRQNKKEIDALELQDSEEGPINYPLLKQLTHIILEQSSAASNNQVDLYQTKRNISSQHSFLAITTKKGSYYLLFSNNLTGVNKEVANCIALTILREYCNEPEASPSKILIDTLERINTIKTKNRIEGLQNFPDSIVLVFKEYDSQGILCAGLNQRIYFAGKNSISYNRQDNFSYQLLHLPGQNTEISDVETVFLFSPNILKLFSESELIVFLNQHFNRDLNVDFTSIIAGKFNQVEDSIVVKLSI